MSHMREIFWTQCTYCDKRISVFKAGMTEDETILCRKCMKDHVEHTRRNGRHYKL